MIQPKMEFLSKSLIEQVIDEAYELLMDPGVVIHNDEALHLLDNAGVEVNFDRKIAKIPQKIVEKALNTVPSSFYLYDYDKQPKVHYGGNDVHFAPASAAVKIFDLKTGKHRTAVTPDFIKWIKLVEGLSYLDSQSTSLVCNDVPKAVTDSYRVYLVLKYAKKPFITGVFDKSGFKVMKDLLVAIAGSEKDLADRPMAVFDACPSPPLQWSDATAHSLINCARYNIPSELISMPLVGATAPATILGSLVQHTAESFSGLVINQLAKPGAPIVYGGAPELFDMRSGISSTGAIETVMLSCAYTQIGKYLGVPTHGYVGLSDAKICGVQSGIEDTMGIILGSLAGMNMISGTCALNFLLTLSYEKLIIDNEIIGIAKRMLKGIVPREENLATTVIRRVGHKGNFLSDPHTLRMFKKDQFFPSSIIDRHSLDDWQKKGVKGTNQQAIDKIPEILAQYQLKDIPGEVERELDKIMTYSLRKYGMDEIPESAKE